MVAPIIKEEYKLVLINLEYDNGVFIYIKKMITLTNISIFS